ncbi:methionyl-tRNA formyltransferase [Gammaproteobacteria bacterium]|jgi:methionyl-tRNA formyltransferase|nr:methionyl-tRNA formyltransferase [Gammaproteobacteria bacterium]
MSNDNFIIASHKPWNKDLAKDLSLETNKNFNLLSNHKDLNLSYLERIKPKYIFFTHWSYIIPEEIFFNYECIVFHMTDLPFGRGGSPLQNLISLGYDKTKVSALRVVKELDAGDIYMKRDLSLEGTAQEIYERASEVCRDIIIDIVANNPKPIAQTGDPHIFYRKKPEDGNLKNAVTTKDVYNMIRMLDAESYPHAFIQIGPFKIEFTEAFKDGKFVEAKAIFTNIED